MGTEKNEIWVITPPEPVSTFLYRCDNKFFTHPLDDMLCDKATYGLITIGKKKASVATIHGTKIDVMKYFTSGLHGKNNAGGQSQSRFDRLLLEGEKWFYRKVARFANRKFSDVDELCGIFVGGSGESKKRFLNDGDLKSSFADKVADVVDLPYDGGYEAVRSLVDKVADNMDELQYVREKKIVDRFMEHVGNDDGLAIYGTVKIRDALNYGLLEEIIATDSNLLSLEQKEKIASTGGDLHVISSDTEGGAMIRDTFGGVVAIARYRF